VRTVPLSRVAALPYATAKLIMYELFMTSSVDGGEINAACSILSGLCGMPPWETVTRVLYFQGPPRPTGISNQTSIDKPVRREVGLLWKDMHQSLARQSFVLQARYEVSRETDMGPHAPAVDLDAEPGILRWIDFPDPPHGRPLLTQRKFVELWEQKHLLSVMRDNHYQ
jgi:mediator of RNA polymerase II transcription subunit 18